jgi:hypothetical protein
MVILDKGKLCLVTPLYQQPSTESALGQRSRDSIRSFLDLLMPILLQKNTVYIVIDIDVIYAMEAEK